ncbi:MAG: hypothetical protein DI498_14640 [Paracoccus denitrificans]|nr:MAG: hypothetical protein DI498_14640 [Paracoccus denitrificans]PZO82659.1 MAG: hypothetical protein DI633_14640 [Paracoccus denitrificans]
MRVQMIGLCRFSYVGQGGYQVAHPTIEAQRAFVYDPERLARRWYWFENVTLPALLRQSDPDFTLVILTGDDLPQPYLSQLRDLADFMPQVRLELRPPGGRHLAVCADAVLPHISSDADVVGHFRQDDDDAVAVDYIERGKADFSLLKPVWQRAKGQAYIDYGRGLLLQAHADGVDVSGHVLYHNVSGLTAYLRPKARKTIMSFSHFRIAMHMPGLMMNEAAMYVRLLNYDNDSATKGAGHVWGEKGDVDWQEILARRFMIDLPTLRKGAIDFGLPTALRRDRLAQIRAIGRASAKPQ